MPNKIEYKYMEKVGECYYLREADRIVFPSGNGARRAYFLCPICNSEFVSIIRNVKSLSIRSCKCLKRDLFKRRATVHGMRYSPIYDRWIDMKKRCYNKKNKSYPYYGGRGISVYEEWIEDFAAFHNYVSTLSRYGERGVTIDRINNNGNYEPGNIRWTDMSQQAINRRNKVSGSGYVGIYCNFGGFEARIVIKGTTIYIGFFKEKIDAINARNKFIIDNDLDECRLQKWRG